MKTIFAIARLTLRTAVRSRILVLLGLLVVIGVVGLPFVLKSDGTLFGQTQLFLNYALGLTAALLSLAAVWSGAGAVSREVESRQIHLVVTKPVHAAQLWLGKWLGLMIMNAALVALAGALVYGGLLWTLRPDRQSPDDRRKLREEILVALTPLLPESASSRNQAPAQPVAVPPGGRARWFFQLSETVHSGAVVLLNFRFASAQPLNIAPMAGQWSAGAGRGPVFFCEPVARAPNMTHTLRIPLSTDDHQLTLEYRNQETDYPATVVFMPDEVTLRVRAGGFEANYVRALVLILARLGFFTALGLTAGAMFSFPVAAFVSCALLLMAALGRMAADVTRAGMSEPALSEAGAAQSFGWLDFLMRAAGWVLQALLPPLERFDPLDFLPSTWISWACAGEGLLVLTGIYGGALALLGIWLFSRRELGLPAD